MYLFVNRAETASAVVAVVANMRTRSTQTWRSYAPLCRTTEYEKWPRKAARRFCNPVCVPGSGFLAQDDVNSRRTRSLRVDEFTVLRLEGGLTVSTIVQNQEKQVGSPWICVRVSVERTTFAKLLSFTPPHFPRERIEVAALPPSRIPRLCGDEWQDWANKLLTAHYGPADYQRIPDNDKGDSGLEGFTISLGHAFQAYGCEEPLTTQARYEKQRIKMTEDVGKFIRNQEKLARIFGSMKVTRWILFVPYYDSKEIVAHAATKTDEVVNAKLPYVADSFRVKVCHEEDFVIARDQLIMAGTRALDVITDPATLDQVTRWADANDEQATTLEEKLARLPSLSNAQRRAAFRNDVLKWYLEGQAILNALRSYPEVYEKVIRTKSHRESFLTMAAATGSTAGQTLQASIDALKEAMAKEIRELHAFSAEKLVHEAIADWLLRCPLDFPDAIR